MSGYGTAAEQGGEVPPVASGLYVGVGQGW